MHQQAWEHCKKHLETRLDASDFMMWILPLEYYGAKDDGSVILTAPNQYLINNIDQQLLELIGETLGEFGVTQSDIHLVIQKNQGLSESRPESVADLESNDFSFFTNRINPDLTFATHVEGKSNRKARASAKRVADVPGVSFNPLFIYGQTGLGKTHLMQAVGNAILEDNPSARVCYVGAENFVNSMVKAIRESRISEFKDYYRSMDAFLLDDVQFFADKEHSQEELFHTFNSLLENQKQIILASDRQPSELSNIDVRLKSRFAGGLSIAIEPPEIETRVAILMKKAELSRVELDAETAFFIAGCVRSNVRELEGALKNCIATSLVYDNQITLNVAKEALSDRLRYQENQVTIHNIQKVVAEYYRIKMSELLSTRRDRKFARPRQIAMALSKELTTKSLPDIGKEFSGRDHTTVIHAVKKVKELTDSDNSIAEDINNLRNLLT